MLTYTIDELREAERLLSEETEDGLRAHYCDPRNPEDVGVVGAQIVRTVLRMRDTALNAVRLYDEGYLVESDEAAQALVSLGIEKEMLFADFFYASMPHLEAGTSVWLGGQDGRDFFF